MSRLENDVQGRLDVSVAGPSGSLFCPACERPIPLVGRDEVIRHPFAQRLQDSSFAITGWWIVLVGVVFAISLVLLDAGVIDRGMGWMLLFLPPLPGFTIFFVVRCFPRYRVTQCPYCGFRDMTRLRPGGRSGGDRSGGYPADPDSPGRRQEPRRHRVSGTDLGEP
jgi:hypothetical protein